MRYLLIICCIGLLNIKSCSNREEQKPLARVHDKYLYLTEVDQSMFANVNKADSELIMNAYIDKWVQTQLLLKLAENNLSDAEKNVTRELENYRASLLIFKFEQAYINQKMDTLFTEDDLLNYYEQNKMYFILDEPIVKALYIKLKKEAPQVKKIKTLYNSSNEEDIKTLDNLAYQAAVKYDYFSDRWVSLAIIAQQLPAGNEKVISSVVTNSSIELEDEEHVYLVYFKNVMKRGEIVPFEYATDKIREIMFNARRNNLIRDLERKLVAREKDNGTVQVFAN